MSDSGEQKQANESQQHFGEVIELLLADLTSDIANGIRLSALPHWFNPPLLAQLLVDNELAQRVLDAVKTLGVVNQNSLGHYTYPESIRTYLRDWYRRHDPVGFIQANQRALSYFRTQAAPSADPFGVEQLELLYHLLVVDEPAGLTALREQVEDAFDHYLPGQAERLVLRAAEVKSELSDEGQIWVIYYQARLDRIYHRHDFGKAALTTVSQSQYPVPAAFARWSLGELLVEQQRWSEAVKLLQQSLRVMEEKRLLRFVAIVQGALGHAYADLARRSGGLSPAIRHRLGRTGNLRDLERLPFLFYRWLVRFIPWLPNWYFGDDYQDWIVAYLLSESSRWYRLSLRTLHRETSAHDSPRFAQIQLALANLEHQLGRWRWAAQHFAQILRLPIVTSSYYRTARVLSAQGQALLDEGNIAAAMDHLTRALETLRRFEDLATLGDTVAALATAHVRYGDVSAALDAFGVALDAFEKSGDRQAQTTIAHQLEGLGGIFSAERASRSKTEQAQIDDLLGRISERQYVARFPDQLLRLFRRLNLFLVLPLNYLIAFLFIPLFGYEVIQPLVGEVKLLFTVGDSRFSLLIDFCYLIIFMLLPFFILWVYHLIHSLAGYLLTQRLGRRLLPIEHEQPAVVQLDADSISHFDARQETKVILAWPDVTSIQQRDYLLHNKPLPLYSRTLINTPSQSVEISGVTEGYVSAQHLSLAHVHTARGSESSHNVQNFIVFHLGWLLGVLLIVIPLALYKLEPQAWVYVVPDGPDYHVQVYAGAFIIPFLNGCLILYALTLLGRLLWRRFTVAPHLRPAPIVSTRLLILATLIQLGMAFLWIGYRMQWLDL